MPGDHEIYSHVFSIPADLLFPTGCSESIPGGGGRGGTGAGVVMGGGWVNPHRPRGIWLKLVLFL